MNFGAFKKEIDFQAPLIIFNNCHSLGQCGAPRYIFVVANYKSYFNRT